MKTLIKMIAAVALSALCASPAMAFKVTDTSDFIVNGIILKTSQAKGKGGKQADAKCKLELFNENTIIETSEIKMNKPFERKLKKNAWYTLRITKEGYKPLLISFNTALENGDEVLDNLFEFETILIDNETAKFMDQDHIEFPVGIVAYNKKNQKFEARDNYTKNYMASLYLTLPANAPDVAMVYKKAAQHHC